MWNEIFFVYGVALMVVSGLVESKLKDADDSVNDIKYLNSILLSLSVAMTSLITGIVLGRYGLCKSDSNSFSVYASVVLLIFSLIIEGILISIVSNKQFSAIKTAFGKDTAGGSDIRAYILSLLSVNSISMVLVLIGIIYPKKTKRYDLKRASGQGRIEMGSY